MSNYIVETLSIMNLTGEGPGYDICGDTFIKEEEIFNKLVDVIDRNPEKQPVIIFESEPSDEVADAIAELESRLGITHHRVFTSEEAT